MRIYQVIWHQETDPKGPRFIYWFVCQQATLKSSSLIHDVKYLRYPHIYGTTWVFIFSPWGSITVDMLKSPRMQVYWALSGLTTAVRVVHVVRAGGL